MQDSKSSEKKDALKRRDVIKGGAAVLASAFFPFSIQIFNAGEAIAGPPAPSGTGEEKIL